MIGTMGSVLFTSLPFLHSGKVAAFIATALFEREGSKAYRIMVEKKRPLERNYRGENGL